MTNRCQFRFGEGENGVFYPFGWNNSLQFRHLTILLAYVILTARETMFGFEKKEGFDCIDRIHSHKT